MKEFDELLSIFTTLLGPEGCLWDQKQTMRSIRGDLLEECHELLEAIALGDNAAIREELGDVLSVAVFLGKLAEKEGRFSLREAIAAVGEKLVRRHPHVFGDSRISNEDEMWQQWDRIKKSEKGKEERRSVLDGIPTDLPALARAQKVQKKMNNLPVQISQCSETDPEAALGEELWSLVCKARELKVDAEQALRRVLAMREREIRACEVSGPSVDS